MIIRSKLATALTVATASVLSIVSSASAQTTIGTDGIKQTIEENNGNSAAAAVLIDTDDLGNVLGVSAAAGFGSKGATAVALPEFAGAVSGDANGGILINDYYGANAPEVETEAGAAFSGVVGFFSDDTVNAITGSLTGGLIVPPSDSSW